MEELWRKPRGAVEIVDWTKTHIAGLASALALVAYCSLHIVDDTANAVVLMAALATVGTLLGRVPQAPVFACAAGLVGVFSAGFGLVRGVDGQSLVVRAAYLLAAVALLASALLLLRRARTGGG